MDDSKNPFAQAASTLGNVGPLTQIGDAIWGAPLPRRQAQAELLERQGVRDEAKAAAAGEREALSEIVGLVDEVRRSNPGAPSHILSKQILGSERFTRNAMRIPADKMTKFVGDVLGMIAAPESPLPVNVPEGSALVDPRTGVPLFKNEKPVEDFRTKAEVGEVAKRAVGQLDKVVESGQQARMDELALSELERLGDKIGTGGAAAIRGYFSRIGVDLGDASDLNAFESLVDRLTPAQRQGLPGAASDRDVQMFRSSLPSLIRQPEGNRIIIGTLKAMNADRIKRAEIAESVFTGDRTVPEALRAMRALPNPLRRFQESDVGKQLLKGASGNLPDPTQSKRKVFDFDPATGAFTEGK